jgi:hypothetical protein
MTPWPAFDLAAEPQCAGHVAGEQQVVDLRREIREMMQPRSGALKEYDIMRISLGAISK